MSRNISNLSGRIGLKENLFKKISENVLKGSPKDIKEIAKEYNLGVSTIHGAESFYEFLRPAHREKKAFVCNGSACMCAGTQETDQSYGPFQSAVRTNLQLIINERIHTGLSPWIVGLVVCGREDPETGLIVRSAFQRGFSRALNIKAWEKVGAVPLSCKCLSSPKVRRSIGNGNDNQQVLVHLIFEHNTIPCYALLLEGYNGDVIRVTLKPIERTTVITVAHSQEHIELLSQAKAHGSIFLTTGGVHLTAKDIFKSNAFKHHKILREKLGKDKTLRDRQEKNKSVALDILQRKGENPTTMTGTDHQHPKVASLNKNAKFVAWMEIKRREKAPPAFNKCCP